MSFPVYLNFGGLRWHPHWVFETLAYAVAFRVYLYLRRGRGDVLDDSRRWWVIAAAAVGAVLGSKMLYWFEDPRLTLAHWNDPAALLGGKTIVGALIGGLLAVEWAKKRSGRFAANWRFVRGAVVYRHCYGPNRLFSYRAG